MPADSVAHLAQVLGVSPDELSVLAGYDDAQVAALAGAVEAAIETDTATMQQSIEHALRVIPRPIRGRARQILTGERHG